LKPYGYTELLEDVLKLTALYSEKVSVEIIGKSVKGRLLPLIKSGKGKRKLLMVGAVHGREFVSAAFLMRSVGELLSETEISHASLYVVPMLNPDGVETALLKGSELFKNNANNVNLNANFPFFFEKVPKSRQGGGFAASEPETKALIRLCEKERFSSALALHARGNCIFWRDEGNKEILGDFELAKRFEKECGFELISSTKKAEDYSGGFENWFRCRYKRPALCIELVKDEEISFFDMCQNFEDAVIWSKTKNLLKTYIN